MAAPRRQWPGWPLARAGSAAAEGEGEREANERQMTVLLGRLLLRRRLSLRNERRRGEGAPAAAAENALEFLGVESQREKDDLNLNRCSFLRESSFS